MRRATAPRATVEMFVAGARARPLLQYLAQKFDLGPLRAFQARLYDVARDGLVSVDWTETSAKRVQINGDSVLASKGLFRGQWRHTDIEPGGAQVAVALMNNCRPTLVDTLVDTSQCATDAQVEAEVARLFYLSMKEQQEQLKPLSAERLPMSAMQLMSGLIGHAGPGLDPDEERFMYFFAMNLPEHKRYDSDFTRSTWAYFALIGDYVRFLAAVKEWAEFEPWKSYMTREAIDARLTDRVSKQKALAPTDLVVREEVEKAARGQPHRLHDAFNHLGAGYWRLPK